jgi:hypothetical protein
MLERVFYAVDDLLSQASILTFVSFRGSGLFNGPIVAEKNGKNDGLRLAPANPLIMPFAF